MLTDFIILRSQIHPKRQVSLFLIPFKSASCSITRQAFHISFAPPPASRSELKHSRNAIRILCWIDSTLAVQQLETSGWPEDRGEEGFQMGLEGDSFPFCYFSVFFHYSLGVWLWQWRTERSAWSRQQIFPILPSSPVFLKIYS